MMTLDDLVAIRDIEQVKYRYMRAVDTQQWDLLASCFTDDATVWYSGGNYQCTGRAEIVDWLRSVMTPAFIGSHVALHPEICLTGPATAKGIWRLQDIVHFTEANEAFSHANIRGGEEMVGAGHYYDEYVKQADGWKISRTGYVRIFESIESRDHRPGFRLDADPARGIRT